LISTAAFAQSSSPGPYVIDVRGAMVGAPTGRSFYYVAPSGTLIPTRAFGIEGGAHVYPFHLGVARIGIGAEGLRTRGAATTPAASITSTPKPLSDVQASMEVSSVSGQVSFNFGTRDGWSYLTAGYGDTRTGSEVLHETFGPIVHSVVVLKRHTPTINFGGGARWFIREHLGVGFDVRFHRLGASEGYPSKQLLALSVGVSMR
jgi:hypothetical protein